jgi:hypothetical protein
VAVTHWTAADVQREAKLKEAHREITPDKTIDDFADLLPMILQTRQSATQKIKP